MGERVKKLQTTVLLLICAVAAQAQDDRRARIDVDAYSIDAQINPATQTLNARAQIRFTALEDRMNAATFELNNNLTVTAITDDKGQPLQSSRDQNENALRVTFPNYLPKGQSVVITVLWNGHLTGTEESPIYGVKFAAIQPDYAFLLYPSRWFPIANYTAGRFSATLNVSVPAGFRVVASGTGTSRPDGANTLFTYTFGQRSFPGSLAVVKGQPTVNATDGVTTTLWFRGAEAASADAWGAMTANMINHFSDIYGLAPSANLTLIETEDGAPNGYAAPGLIFLSPRVITKDVNVNVLANQIGRQWWEELVSPANRNHLWIENGMASYTEALWTEKEKGASALEQRIHDSAVNALTVDNVPMIQTARMEDYSPEYWAISSGKGSVVMNMLRGVLGDEKFTEFLKTLLKEYAWKSVTTDTLKDVASKVAGTDMRWFFMQWVESSGAPEFKLEYTIFRTTKGFRVQGKISQDLDLFRMPVDLKIETEGNPEEKRIDVMGTSSEFSIDTFGKPKKITIDAGNNLLRMSPQMRVEVAIRKGEQFVQINEFAEALKEYQRALDTQKNSSMAHYRVAEVFFMQHNYQSAANEFREALNGDLNPKWVEVWSHIYLGKVFDISGQRERAVNEYTQAQRTRDNTSGAQDEVAKYLKTPYAEKARDSQ